MIDIPSTDKTPAIKFDWEVGTLSIEGKSLVENAYDFYKPLLDELKEYCKKPCRQTIINIKLEYFNTSSSKSILDVLRKVEDIKSSSKIKVNWYYEKCDDDMLEVGEDYQSIIKIPFTMIEFSQ